LDRPLGQGFDQQLAQFAAQHLGPPARAVVGLFQQHGAVAVERARGLTALVDQGAETVDQAGGLQRDLSVMVMDVEQAALGAGLGRRFGLIDRRGDAVDVQDAGEDEAAETGADDGDVRRHGRFPSNWNDVPETRQLEHRSIHVKMGP
jgi:hypothetical protein